MSEMKILTEAEMVNVFNKTMKVFSQNKIDNDFIKHFQKHKDLSKNNMKVMLLDKYRIKLEQRRNKK